MVNHVRTVLLNLPRLPATDLGELEEFIPSSFQTRAYSGSMARIADAIMPAALSRRAKNIRVSGLLQLVHVPDLNGYALQPDARITYPLRDDRAILTQIAENETPSLARRDIGADLQRAIAGPDGYALFGTSGVPAYITELRNFWLHGVDPGVRAGAAMLAFVLQSDRVHNAS